ncbi:MAG: GNAT family N-acetyltransferase [archaeon]
MNDLKIRQMKRTDLKELSRLYVKVYVCFDVGERWDIKSAHALLLHWFKRQPDLCFVAELKGRLAGAFVTGIKPWCDGNHLFDGEVFVDPDVQAKGIGTELSIAVYEKAVKKYKAVCFEATTFKLKKHPLSWYKSLGFKEVDYLTLISGDLKEALGKLKARR